MKKITNTLIAIFFLTQFNLFSQNQDTITIQFTPEYNLSNDIGYGFMKLIDNHSDTVYYDGVPYKVTFPKQFFVSDTALAFNYFRGWKDRKIGTAFLLGNYTSYSPILYVDYNHNLDFSDDGLPLKLNNDSTVVVYLKNPEFPFSSFPLKFYYEKLTPKQKKQNEPLFSSMGLDVEGNNITSIDYWLAGIRMNYKITNTWLNGKNIKIGLSDYNCNAIYNDKGEDRILIGNYEENFISVKLDKGAVTYNENIQISIADEVYEVTEIDPLGMFLKLIKSDSIYRKPLGIGDQVSDLEIKFISGESKKIKEVQEKDKFLLLDFWGSWCKGCTQQLPLLKELEKDQSNKLQIIGLNYGDNLSSINQYLSKYNVDWKNGYANEGIMKKMRIEKFPNYLLLDSKGKIVLMNASIEEIKEKL